MLVFLSSHQFLIFMLILIPVAALVYWNSVRSRQQFECKECGEQITTEHLDAKYCSSCGAPLR